MALSSSETAFYRDLLSIFGNDAVKNYLTKYANMQINSAVNSLEHETDAVKIYRAQGSLSAWKRIANLHAEVLNILNKAQ